MPINSSWTKPLIEQEAIEEAAKFGITLVLPRDFNKLLKWHMEGDEVGFTYSSGTFKIVK